MRFKVTSIFLLILLSVVAVGHGQTGQRGGHGKYYFYPLTGRAILSRTEGANWLALQKAQPVEVRPGDMINVEGTGRGELHFPDGSVVRIKNNAMLTLGRYGISLRLGYAWLNVRRSTDTFTVNTPLGTCTVLGTSFDLSVDQFGKGLVRVFDGIVAVKAAEMEGRRQLVLQQSMQTRLTDRNKISQRPDKFNSQTIGKAIASEWEPRQFMDERLPASLQPSLPPEEMEKKRTLQAPSQIPVGLPLMRPEIEEQLEKAKETYEYRPSETVTEGEFTVRKRSEFQEMLMQRQLSRDSVIGGYNLKEEMEKDGHGKGFGHSARARSGIAVSGGNHDYAGARNRLLRLQGEISQLKMQINGMISENKTTLTHQRKISEAQGQLVELQQEHRFLQNQLRNMGKQGLR